MDSKCFMNEMVTGAERIVEGHSNKEDKEKWAGKKGEKRNALEYFDSPLS